MIRIDGDELTVSGDGAPPRTMPIGSPEAFAILSRLWLRSGWDAKYVYGFSWLGRPVIQLPEDLIRLQELIYRVRPDLIIETGVAHGGSLVFSAGILKVLGGDRRVVGVDVEIRPPNRAALESHPLSSMITLIEGDSIAPDTVTQVKALVGPDDTVMVLLDGCHEKTHVLAELEAYAPLLAPGSYVIAMDGIMQDLVGAPRSGSDWATNNPRQAALEFTRRHDGFVIEEPDPPFNEGAVTERVTYWPGGIIRRVS